MATVPPNFIASFPACLQRSARSSGVVLSDSNAAKKSASSNGCVASPLAANASPPVAESCPPSFGAAAVVCSRSRSFSSLRFAAASSRSSSSAEPKGKAARR
eukprot:CAMPEP_0181179826 /NCGR_PEP_ID=MMETSP1096-20121128/6470_1 /TAXON_ID=156174 ORGANISM="Chrysochromulina ericina, Strain CCMP281" /NCGR_SAMPLE_ID=MMETSP1096 /ASSEMBLY_ACC=CAM_ASM_000453 /LENGTH=101 /DNA_ID=CAMNT_0023268207 /DNA_START=2195 /DNA_END=2498 /DNA_ORIENTATION=-